MLNRTESTLPSSWYFEPEQYRRELEAIWWQGWLCVGREDEWPATGSYRIVGVGGQQILIARAATGVLHAFHNTCRHRGSLLCETLAGTFRQSRIVCPYHAWTYSLEGRLTHTPRNPQTPDFKLQDHSLYQVALQTHAGFVFINLAAEPGTDLEQQLAQELKCLANWPLDELALAHREVHTVNCNWKVFWENFLECYHCPVIHHDLCRLVPVYAEGVTAPQDLPSSHPLHSAAGTARLAEGAVTWSTDGKSALPWFSGLSQQEQAAGMTFANVVPSMFIVAHVDYVRSVQVLPLGPEQTQLSVNWLLLPQTLARGEVDIPSLTAFGNQVVMEDARICELNQRGLHCLRHDHGVLAPHEYDVLAFDQWVLARLADSSRA